MTKKACGGTLVPMKKLTPLQEKVLQFLREYLARHGYPPTIREIKEGLDMSGHSSVQNALHALENAGFIKRSRKARGIELAENLQPKKSVELPVAGTIRAGYPHAAVEDVEDYIAVDSQFAKDKNNFLLKVEGDSMVEDHILDGDYVVVQPRPEAKNGDIVAILIEDEATVKRFYKRNGCIHLEPANPEYDTIIVTPETPEVMIIGKIEAVLRNFKNTGGIHD